MTNYRLTLASNSSRRKELLSGINVEYTIKTLPDIDESYPCTLPQDEVAEFLARKKAKAYLPEIGSDELVITAGTIVLLNGEILGKPTDKTEAKQMLRKLSGQRHCVITGVCLTTCRKQKSFSDTTFVTFRELSDEEIDYYVEKYHPLDKAGAYGIQEWIGYVAVQHIEGSYFNVMGLPIYRVYQELVSVFGLKNKGILDA